MFEDALKTVLKLEGGFSDDPDDPGGRTNFGITQYTYDPSFKKDVKDITEEEVSRIYKNQYWTEGKCDVINTTNPNLAFVHFDNCVNCGTGGAAKMLQDILGVEQDGIIGSLTLARIQDTESLVEKYLSRRKLYYDRLIETKPILAKFKASWYHRLTYLAKQLNIDWNAN